VGCSFPSLPAWWGGYGSEEQLSWPHCTVAESLDPMRLCQPSSIGLSKRRSSPPGRCRRVSWGFRGPHGSHTWISLVHISHMTHASLVLLCILRHDCRQWARAPHHVFAATLHVGHEDS
jgi:hypothetical protein